MGCFGNYPAAKCPEPTHISASSGIEDYVVEQFFSAVGEMAATPVVDDGSLAT
jgi:hypothetical protein